MLHKECLLCIWTAHSKMTHVSIFAHLVPCSGEEDTSTVLVFQIWGWVKGKIMVRLKYIKSSSKKSPLHGSRSLSLSPAPNHPPRSFSLPSLNEWMNEWMIYCRSIWPKCPKHAKCSKCKCRCTRSHLDWKSGIPTWNYWLPSCNVCTARKLFACSSLQ